MKIYKVLFSSVVRKWMMALTGAFLVFFLVIHLAGNLLVFKGSELFNQYAHFLASVPVLKFIELILVLCFVYHATYGIVERTRSYFKARGGGRYAVRQSAKGSRRGFSAATAAVTGVIILVFVIFHVWTMKYGEPGVAPDKRDVYAWLLYRMSNPWEAGFYTFSIAALMIHLHNGCGTLYESIGIAHRCWLRLLGQIFGVLLALGFMILPIYLHLVAIGRL